MIKTINDLLKEKFNAKPHGKYFVDENNLFYGEITPIFKMILCSKHKEFNIDAFKKYCTENKSTVSSSVQFYIPSQKINKSLRAIDIAMLNNANDEITSTLLNCGAKLSTRIFYALAYAYRPGKANRVDAYDVTCSILLSRFLKYNCGKICDYDIIRSLYYYYDKIFRVLIDNNFDFYSKDKNGCGILFGYSSSGYEKGRDDLCDCLRRHNINVNYRDTNNFLRNTLYHYTEINIEFLKMANININHADIYGNTAIMHKCIDSDNSLLQLHIDNNIDFDANIVNNDGNSILSILVKQKNYYRNYDVIKFIVTNKKININSLKNDKFDIFEYCCEKKINYKIIKLLLSCECNYFENGYILKNLSDDFIVLHPKQIYNAINNKYIGDFESETISLLKLYVKSIKTKNPKSFEFKILKCIINNSSDTLFKNSQESLKLLHSDNTDLFFAYLEKHFMSNNALELVVSNDFPEEVIDIIVTKRYVYNNNKRLLKKIKNARDIVYSKINNIIMLSTKYFYNKNNNIENTKDKKLEMLFDTKNNKDYEQCLLYYYNTNN